MCCCNHKEPKDLSPRPPEDSWHRERKVTLTPLLGSAVQPSSAWEALESRRITMEKEGQRGQKIRRSGRWEEPFCEFTVNLLRGQRQIFPIPYLPMKGWDVS